MKAELAEDWRLAPQNGAWGVVMASKRVFLVIRWLLQTAAATEAEPNHWATRDPNCVFLLFEGCLDSILCTMPATANGPRHALVTGPVSAWGPSEKRPAEDGVSGTGSPAHDLLGRHPEITAPRIFQLLSVTLHCRHLAAPMATVRSGYGTKPEAGELFTDHSLMFHQNGALIWSRSRLRSFALEATGGLPYYPSASQRVPSGSPRLRLPHEPLLRSIYRGRPGLVHGRERRDSVLSGPLTAFGQHAVREIGEVLIRMSGTVPVIATDHVLIGPRHIAKGTVMREHNSV